MANTYADRQLRRSRNVADKDARLLNEAHRLASEAIGDEGMAKMEAQRLALMEAAITDGAAVSRNDPEIPVGRVIAECERRGLLKERQIRRLRAALSEYVQPQREATEALDGKAEDIADACRLAAWVEQQGGLASVLRKAFNEGHAVGTVGAAPNDARLFTQFVSSSAYGSLPEWAKVTDDDA